METAIQPNDSTPLIAPSMPAMSELEMQIVDAAEKNRKRKAEPKRPSANRPALNEIVLTFKYPAVQGTHRDYVLSPVVGQQEGAFPQGAPSIVSGSSGTGKTTWLIEALVRQSEKKGVWGHQTIGLRYVVFMLDRGRDSYLRTMERLGYDPDKTPVELVPMAIGEAALREILGRIEKYGAGAMPQIVFIEGADMMVEDANKGQYVVPFMHGLQQIAEHYHIAIILSVGAPKLKVGEGYTAKRDSILGSEKWSRMAETVVTMHYLSDDETELRRVAFVLLRNGPAEKFNLIFENGKLVKNTQATSQDSASQVPEIEWFKEQAVLAKADPAKKWWTRLDMERGLKKSEPTIRRWVGDALAKHHITEKPGKKTGRGRGHAPQYRWNESKTNPLWVEQQGEREDQLPI